MARSPVVEVEWEGGQVLCRHVTSLLLVLILSLVILNYAQTKG